MAISNTKDANDKTNNKQLTQFYNSKDFTFGIDHMLDDQNDLQRLPFLKMDKSKAPACQRYLSDRCELGDFCPHRHMNSKATTVCKHYLNSLCKKGDSCEFLHTYDMTKMAFCHFETPQIKCQNEDCPYIHRKEEVRACQWYERGFCKNGLYCNMKHEQKIMCKNFLNGVCLEGFECKFAHPSWFPLPNPEEQHKQTWTCRNCGGRGHKIQFCNKLSVEERERIRRQIEIKNNSIGFQNGFRRPKDNFHQTCTEVVCFKCGENGHKANVCNKPRIY